MITINSGAIGEIPFGTVFYKIPEETTSFRVVITSECVDPNIQFSASENPFCRGNELLITYSGSAAQKMAVYSVRIELLDFDGNIISSFDDYVRIANVNFDPCS